MKKLILIIGMLTSLSLSAVSLDSLVGELKSCMSTHSLSETTCATLMQIVHLKKQSPFITFTVYKDDGQCSNSRLITSVTLDRTKSFEENEKKCQAFAEKVNSERKDIWGLSVNGSCEDISDIQYYSKDEVKRLCLSKI